MGSGDATVTSRLKMQAVADETVAKGKVKNLAGEQESQS